MYFGTIAKPVSGIAHNLGDYESFCRSFSWNFSDLVKRSRAGSLKSSEVTDPTVTITSLGERGVETVFGIIYPPQLALVGFGQPAQRPWVVEGQVVARTAITATLAGDHRERRSPRRAVSRCPGAPAAATGVPMNAKAMRETVVRLLGEIAPELDPSQLNPAKNLRDQLDLDSMDFLNFMIAMHREFGVEIPEVDYRRLLTLDDCVAYLRAALHSERA